MQINMIATIFTIIVFIAELIIGYTMINSLIKLDKNFIECNRITEDAKPAIKEIAETSRKISEQLKELAPIWVQNLKDKTDDFIISKVKNILVGFLFWALNSYLKKKYDID